jgi:hypothetical protein
LKGLGRTNKSNSPEKDSRNSSRKLLEKKKVSFLIPKLSGFSPSNTLISVKKLEINKK